MRFTTFDLGGHSQGPNMLYHIICLTIISLASANQLSFPNDFKFGMATAAYQIEGGWNASGKGESIWDYLVHHHPEKVVDRSTGDIACDSYHLWKEDVNLLKHAGVDFYRFSISWPRLLPTGFSYYINPDAIRYYDDLINELLKNNIEPTVTLYHWDLPKTLQDMGGWTNEVIADYFEEYANVAFNLFGDRVKIWITFNEPLQICETGYGDGILAPGVKSSGISDYMCGRTLLLAHARVYHLYTEVYKPQQDGTIGIVISTVWAEPKTNSFDDIEAAERSLQMKFGWWAHPIFSQNGDYPQVMKDRIANVSKTEKFNQSRLPEFTQEEVQFIRGTSDFLGLNHYTSQLISDVQIPENSPVSFHKDVSVLEDVSPTWNKSAAPWLSVVPWGMQKILNWIKREYNNPIIHITENGYADAGGLIDNERIEYFRGYIDALLKAIVLDGCNVKRYTAWSLMDNMEWVDGYTLKYGLYHVDFTDPNRTRTPKASLEFFRNIIKTRKLPV